MIVSKNLSKLILWSFIAISFADAIDQAQYLESFSFLSNLTYIFGVAKYGSLILLIYVMAIGQSYLLLVPKPAKYIFLGWCACCFYSIMRGFFNAEDYWDWRFLILENLLRYSVHFAIIAGILFTPMIPIQKFVGKWVFGLALILIFVSLGKFDIVFSYLVLPITLLIFYIPYSDLKTKLLYILIALASAVLAIEFRANFMRIGVGLFIVLLYYGKVFENRLFKIALKPVQVLTFVLPVFLLYLGITGQFNIFSDLFTSAVMTTNVNGDENLAADTRTFLYYEVFRSLINEEAFIFGLGASGSYESYSFSYLVDNRRYASETGFLNVLLNMGIVGVVSYFFVLYSASYYALFRSNNSLAKMIGLFLIFRWVLFFVEDMTAYGVSMYFLWISIGLCYSNRFRNLTDADLVSLLKAPKVG